MKKLFTLIVAMMAFATSSMAIDYIPEEGVSFQGLFGMNISNLRGVDMNAKAGMNFGVKMEYMLPECYGVYANVGVNYTMKGARRSFDIPEVGSVTLVSRPCYLEIPLHVGYRYNLTEDMGVYADFGPYFAFGLNGKWRSKAGEYLEHETERFFNLDYVQRTDFGLGFRIGCEYINHHSITFSMDWGLTDMWKDSFHRGVMGIDELLIPENSVYNFPIFNEHFKAQSLPKMKNFNCSVTYGYRF